MDYLPILDTVNEMINDFGKPILLIKTQGINIDNSKPWKTNEVGIDTELVQTVEAVSVPVSSASEMGFSTTTVEMLKESKRVFLVAPGISENSEILETFNFVESDSIRAVINVVDKLKPADTTLLYVIGVSR